MPSEELETQTTDTTIEPAIEEAYTPVDTGNNIIAENSHKTIDTPDTHTSQDNIYKTIIEKGEENIEPSGTTSQTYLTTTPADETAPYTETDQIPPDISQYTGQVIAPNRQEELLFEQQEPWHEVFHYRRKS